MSDCTEALKERIAQLEAELWAERQRSLVQRRRLAQKYGREFLTLIDDPNTRVTITNIVQKVVLQDEEGNIISENDGSLVGKIIKIRFKSLH